MAYTDNNPNSVNPPQWSYVNPQPGSPNPNIWDATNFGIPPSNNSGVGNIWGNNNYSVSSSTPSYPSGMSTATADSSALGALPGVALGLYQTIWGGQQLKSLERQPMPNYSVSPELSNAYNEALGQKDQGLSPEENTALQSNINRGTATNIYNSQKEGGGSLSNVVSGIASSDQLSAYDQVAALNAKMRESHLQDYYKLTDTVQQQKNLISQQQIAQRMELEEAYGKELQSGISNITKGVSSLSFLAPFL